MRGWLTADIGGTKLAVAAFDGETLSARLERPTEAARGAGTVLDDLADMLRQCAARAGLTDILGVGVACPGPLSARKGIVYRAPMLGWKDMPLAARLREALQCPVLVENDANAAAYGEYQRGAGQGCESMAYITVSTGVGCGLIVRGEILAGFHEGAGELGHISLEPEGLPCACGRRGCLELYASGTAIGRMTSEVMGLPVSAREAAVLAAGGSAEAQRAFDRAGRGLGRAIGMLQQMLDPECVVLGGSVTQALPLMREALVKTVQKTSYWGERPEEWLRVARLQPDSGLWGAALLARKRWPG